MEIKKKKQVPLPPPPWTDHPNGITLLHPPLCHHCTSDLDFLASASSASPPPPPPRLSSHQHNKPPSKPPPRPLPSNRRNSTPSPPPTPNPIPKTAPTATPPLRKKPSLLSTLTSKLRHRASSAQLHTPVAASVVKSKNRSSASGAGKREERSVGGWWGERNIRGRGTGYKEEEGSLEMVEMR